MPYSGSQAVAGQGTQLQHGDGGSPENFTTVAEMEKIQGSGSKADVVDVTNMDSTSAFREKLVTLLDAGEIAFDGNFIAGDAEQQTLWNDFNNRTKHNYKIVLPTRWAISASRPT